MSLKVIQKLSRQVYKPLDEGMALPKLTLAENQYALHSENIEIHIALQVTVNKLNQQS